MNAIRGVLGATGSHGTVHFEHGVISAVSTSDPSSAGASGAVDVGDAFIVPGFVDLQVNGVGAFDFGSAADEQGIARGLDAITASGTTTCLPTIVTAPLRQYDAMLDRVRASRALDDASSRCSVAGVHIEGPFLGGAPGAHPRELIRDVDLHWLDGLLRRHRDLIRMFTIAPEADPDLAGIRLIAAAGVVVAIGHSVCSCAEAIAAADAGARAVTHLFNGMSGLHHRTPGVVAAALLDDRLTPTLIADLVHVHPAAILVALAAKRDVVAITDAVAPASGASGGLHIVERDGAAYLDDGTLAGSVLTMDAALRNLVAMGVSFDRALAMTTTAPCELVGLTDRGRLEPGARADLVVLTPDTLAVDQVWIGGERVR